MGGMGIPVERMKMRVMHIVPLSRPALALLVTHLEAFADRSYFHNEC